MSDVSRLGIRRLLGCRLIWIKVDLLPLRSEESVAGDLEKSQNMDCLV